MKRELRSHTAGATLIEFAIVAPALILMLIGLIETGRLFWARHVLNDVAYATVRCMSVSSDCASVQASRSFAVNRAAGLGLKVGSESVTIGENTDCKGLTGANRVVIAVPYSSALKGFIPGTPDSISAQACFPRLASDENAGN